MNEVFENPKSVEYRLRYRCSALRYAWRLFNYWTSARAWKHLLNFISTCSHANMTSPFWDKWSW